MIEVAGRIEDAVGKPILYKVTPLFLDYFGINSTKELPKLKDIITPDENSIGEQNEIVSDLPPITLHREEEKAEETTEIPGE